MVSGVTKKLHENVRDGRGSYFFHGAGRGKAKNLWGLIVITICITIIISISIIITISIITNINAIIINATRDDILDMEELCISYVDKFLRTKFDALLAKKNKVLTFYFLLHILLTGWIGHCSVL